MSEVNVENYAAILGISPDMLIKQLESAGVTGKTKNDNLNDLEKKTLLESLKNSHGSVKNTENAKSGKITLTKKTSLTLGAKRGSSSSSKGVSVEVRKKKTFIKKPIETEATVSGSEKTKIKQEIVEKRNEEDARLAELEKARKELHIKKKQDALQIEEDKKNKEELDAKEKLRNEKIKEIEEKQAKKAAEKFLAAKKEKAVASKTPNKAPARRKEIHVNKGNKKGKKRQDSKVKDNVIKVSSSEEHGFQKPTKPVVLEVEIPETVTVGELSQKMAVKAGDLLKVMMSNGIMATINQSIDQDTAYLLVEEMGHTPVAITEVSKEDELRDLQISSEEKGELRAPVVTIMGHVDHGKTSLLDCIRKSQVTKNEAGGITQHIGAYKVSADKGDIVFLDTPGHAAFSSMRSRGAKVTDIVIIVVAGDDSVMPQTVEAIQHAQKSGVSIIVAVNKSDKPEFDLEKVKNEMSNYEMVPEDWGGDVPFVPVSALTGEGIDSLLESVLLTSEILELKAPINAKARGSVIEARIEKGRGPVATVIIQSGTLKKGDIMLAGREYGKIRSMTDDQGNAITSAGPSTPVEVLGLSGVPDSGSDTLVVDKERQARDLAQDRINKFRNLKLAKQKQATLDRMFSKMEQGDLAEINVLVKADVHGSAEAICDSLTKISNDEVKVVIVSSGVGGINESDANLALAANAILVGFNVRADASAKKIINKDNLSLHYFSIIYDLINLVESLVLGEMKSHFEEKIIGIAEVKDVFNAQSLGKIAGCIITEGTVRRDSPIRVLRDNTVIFEGELESLRRFKDDVKEVKSGVECGIGVKAYDDVRAGDSIEVFERVEVKRTL